MISYEDCCKWGLFGPIARAAGGDYDVRRAFPYIGYDTYEFDVIGASNGDVYDRYLTRVAEMRESVKICNQALERITPVGAWAARRQARRPAAEGPGLHGDGSADSALPDLLAGLQGAGR